MGAGRYGLGWYLTRLRVMGPAEIGHRLSEQAGLRAMQLCYAAGRAGSRHQPACDFCETSRQQLPELPWEFDPDDDAVVRGLLDGKLSVMSWTWHWQPGQSSWHMAPDTGNCWPRGFFGTMPYRPGNAFGDVRVAWEPSRLQQLVALALLATRAQGAVAERALTTLEAMFLDWVADNPAHEGIHYISAMECALRLIACCHALDMVRDRLANPAQTWPALVRLVDEHARLIERRLSLHSSANNHLVCEAAGLAYAGVLFPELSRASRWRASGLRILANEAQRQILPDGGSAEQTFWYQCLVTDLYGLVTALLSHRGEPVPDAIAAACLRGRGFLNAFADRPGDIPAIGDCDNGYALSPYLRLSWNRPVRNPQNKVSVFADAGYTLLQDSTVRACLIFDHGSLGLAPTFVHGHADALSVLLRIGNDDILIDPGTCTYSGDIQWRRYFRGTRAHNTVTVDGHDQATQETRFMWSKPYDAALVWREEREDGQVFLLGHHNGYHDNGGITHWRGIVMKPSFALVVLDMITGQGKHAVELNWHLGADVVGQDDGSWLLTGTAQPVKITVDGAEARLLRADTAEQAGWCSPRYGAREPACTLRSTVTTDLPFEYLTTIRIGDNAIRQPVCVDAELDILRDRIHETQAH